MNLQERKTFFLFCTVFLANNIPFNSSQTRMLLFSTIQRRSIFSHLFFSHPKERDNIDHIFLSISFPFFSTPGGGGIISFLFPQLVCEERLCSIQKSQPLTDLKHGLFVQHKLVLYSFLPHSWKTPKCSRVPESQQKHYCERHSHILYAEQLKPSLVQRSREAC